MSDEKKIKTYRKRIVLWVGEIENNYKKLQKAADERKKEKIQQKIQDNKRRLNNYIERLIKEDGDTKEVLKGLTDSQRAIIEEMYPTGTDSNTIAVEKEIERIKKLIHEELNKVSEKEDYDADDPIEQKLKNKKFSQEAFVGSSIQWTSRKLTFTGKPNPKYNNYWNYERDYESTKDKYFTKEEQELIAKCVSSRAEEKAYLLKKREWLGNLGESIKDFSERLDEWGDEAIAKYWVRKLQNDVFPDSVEEIYGKLPKKEAEEKAKEMTRRYVEFVRDPEKMEMARQLNEASVNDADAVRRQLNGIEPVTSGILAGRSESELRELRKIASEKVEKQDLLAYYLLRETAGVELAIFTFMSSHDTNIELLNSYSLEELGL